MKLAFRLFAKSLFLNLLIAAQLCAAAVFGMIAAAVLTKVCTYYDITAAIDDAFLYMPAEQDVYFTSSAVRKYTEEGAILLSRAQTHSIYAYDPACSDPQTAFHTHPDTIEEVHSFGAASSAAIEAQLRSGRIYSNEADGDVIECVAVGGRDRFPLGTEIEAAQFRMMITTTEDGNPTIQFEIAATYRFRIVGTCGTSARFPVFTTVSRPADSYDLRDMFEEIRHGSQDPFEKLSENTPIGSGEEEFPSENTVTIACSSEALFGTPFGDTETMSYGGNALFTFSDDIPQEKRDDILAELGREAGVTSMGAARERQSAVIKETIAQYLPILLCFSAMVVVGTLCVAVLNMIRSRSTFRVCFLCGMNLRQGSAILLIYTGILLACAAAMTLLVWTGMSLFGWIPWHSTSFGAPSVLFAAGTLVLSATLMTAVSLPMLGQIAKKGADA